MTAAAAAPSATAPPMIDFELARIAESSEPDLPEALNFDLQIPDMSKVSRQSIKPKQASPSMLQCIELQ